MKKFNKKLICTCFVVNSCITIVEAAPKKWPVLLQPTFRSNWQGLGGQNNQNPETAVKQTENIEKPSHHKRASTTLIITDIMTLTQQPEPSAAAPPLQKSKLETEIIQVDSKDVERMFTLQDKLLILKYTASTPRDIELINSKANNFVDNMFIYHNSLLSRPEYILEIAKLGIKNKIIFSEQLDQPAMNNRTNDAMMEKRSFHEQSLLYLASTQNRLIKRGEEVFSPENDAFNEEKMKQLPIELYDELRQIATDTTNSRVTALITSEIEESTSYAFNREKNKDISYAVSAGENYISELKGLWLRGLYGNIKQGQRLGLIGFNGTTIGTTIGIDYDFIYGSIIGLSYTRLYADFKYKHAQANKVATVSDIISLYGIGNLSNNLVFHGLLSVGKIKIKHTTPHLVDLNTYETAFSNYKANIYSAEGTLSYKIPINNNACYLIPNIGVRFGKNNDDGYSEYGTGIYNLTVSSKHHTTIAVITGIKIGMARQISNNLLLIPAFHMEIDHFIFNKTSLATTKMKWASKSLNDKIIVIKTVKTGYNFGATLLTKYKTIEILPSYNLHLRGKYISHQCSLRLKVLL